MAKKPPKKLTAEDRYLWKKVTDTVKPRGEKPLEVGSLSDADLFSSAMKGNVIFKGNKQQAKVDMTPQKSVKSKPQTPNQPSSDLPPILNMDRKKKSRLARGLREIDGRIDLHGMTQQQAHSALLTFIGRAQASGWKTILVITGKGAQSLDDDGPRYLWMDREAPGVLRRRVPQWLSEPGMRKFIIGYDQAAPNHGGGGAFYVQIRRYKN